MDGSGRFGHEAKIGDAGAIRPALILAVMLLGRDSSHRLNKLWRG